MSRLQWQIDLDAKSGLATLKAFEDAQKKADAGMRRQQKTAKGLSGTFGNLGKTLLGLGGIFGGGLLIRGMGRMITGMADLGDRIAKTSRALGISTDALQKFEFVAERSGIAVEAMNKSMQFMIRNTADAADGFGEALRAFEKLNLNASELKDLRPEEMFLRITDAVNRLESSTDRAQVMYRIFGRSGIELRKITEGGSEAIADLINRFETLGGVLSKDQLDASEAYKDSVTDLEIAFRGLKGALAEDVLPALTSLIGMFTTMIVKAGEAKDAMLSLGEAAEGVTVGPGGELIFMPQIQPTRGELATAFPGGGIPEGSGGPPPVREEDIELINAFEARKERIFADWREIRAEKQAEWDEEQFELQMQRDALLLEQKEEHEAAFLEKELEGIQARVAAREDELRRKQEIEQLALGTTAMMYQSTMAISQAYTAWSGKQSKVLFRIEQAAAIARAIMTTYVATNEALANPPGPPWTYPIAAATLAFGLANVATIAAQKPGGGTVGGAGVGPTAVTGAANALAPETTPLVPLEDREARGQLIINIDNFIGNEEWIDYLVERINEAGDERDVVVRGDVREYQ